MARLLRILFTGLTVLSLVLCVAALVLCLRSDGRHEGFSYQAGHWGASLRSTNGALSVDYVHFDTLTRERRWSFWSNRFTSESETKQFEMYHDSFSIRKVGHLDRVTCTVPLWLVAMLPIAPLAIVALRRRSRERRVAGSRCVACNYDLRATPDRCPECGAIPGGTRTMGAL
jgi:hypothetical protein